MTRLYSRQVARARLEFDASRALKSRGTPSLSLFLFLCAVAVERDPTPRRLSTTPLFVAVQPPRRGEGHANFRGEPVGGVKVAATTPQRRGDEPFQLPPRASTKLRILYCRWFLLLGGTNERTNQGRRMFVPAMNPTRRQLVPGRDDDEHWFVICYAESRGGRRQSAEPFVAPVFQKAWRIAFFEFRPKFGIPLETWKSKSNPDLFQSSSWTAKICDEYIDFLFIYTVFYSVLYYFTVF